MKPVLVLQHLSADGPAYLGDWLRREGRPFEVFDAERGHDFPKAIRGYAALAILGGEMSANDPLRSLRDAERLILDAMQADVPVIGHCLGAQLMARALGATVEPSAVPEVGWHPVQVLPRASARRWFGERTQAVVFQWHYDAFDLPAGVELLARSEACPHQAFSLGPHLAMQFHVEVDAAKVAAWAGAHDERFRAAGDVPTVHSPERMIAGVAAHLARQQRLADRVYAQWMSAARD
jgi:GMP synthase-like glutamine amidotransferase